MRLLILVVSLLAGPALAETHEVRMLNRSDTASMVFEPSFLRLQPGDKVRFLATHATHNAASILEMLPADAEPFKGQIDEEIEVTFTAPGFYGIKCTPHYMMGMVMLVQVGSADPVEAPIPQDIPLQAQQRFQDIVNGEVRR